MYSFDCKTLNWNLTQKHEVVEFLIEIMSLTYTSSLFFKNLEYYNVSICFCHKFGMVIGRGSATFYFVEVVWTMESISYVFNYLSISLCFEWTWCIGLLIFLVLKSQSWNLINKICLCFGHDLVMIFVLILLCDIGYRNKNKNNFV